MMEWLKQNFTLPSLLTIVGMFSGCIGFVILNHYSNQTKFLVYETRLNALEKIVDKTGTKEEQNQIKSDIKDLRQELMGRLNKLDDKLDRVMEKK